MVPSTAIPAASVHSSPVNTGGAQKGLDVGRGNAQGYTQNKSTPNGMCCRQLSDAHASGLVASTLGVT